MSNIYVVVYRFYYATAEKENEAKRGHLLITVCWMFYIFMVFIPRYQPDINLI